MKLSAQLLEDFNNGERSDLLRFRFGDEVVVKDGIIAAVLAQSNALISRVASRRS
jgi:hypothetical protein